MPGNVVASMMLNWTPLTIGHTGKRPINFVGDLATAGTTTLPVTPGLFDIASTGGAKVRMSIGTIAVVAIALTNMSAATAGDPAAAAGKAKTLCAACHGPNGISMNPLWPNLAGQQEQYLAKALSDYRAGNRTDPTMAPLAKSLTDKEIEDLAAYYTGL